MTDDVIHADELREVLEAHGLMVNDIDIRDMREYGPTRIDIDGHLAPDYEVKE